MLVSYAPILVLFLIAVFIAVFVIVLSSQLGPQKPSRRKLMPYESGMEPIGQGQRRTDIRFYRVAMLFIIFDVEVIFLFPYALVYKNLGVYGLAVMGIFFCVLVIGMIYEWRKGALQWD